jgi:hypothetical protein
MSRMRTCRDCRWWDQGNEGLTRVCKKSGVGAGWMAPFALMAEDCESDVVMTSQDFGCNLWDEIEENAS